MLPFIENPLKKAALEVQEYVHMTRAALRGLVTPPMYRYDIIEQLDAVGAASLTVVLLTGFFTGAVLALQSGLTLDQFGARPLVGRLVSASMIKELGPVLTGLMLTAMPALAQTKATMQKLNDRWAEAFNKGDAAAAAAMYTEDAAAGRRGDGQGTSGDRGHVAAEHAADRQRQMHDDRRETARRIGGGRNRHLQLQDESAAAPG